MIVDGRILETRELLLQMRDVLAGNCGQEVCIEVYLTREAETKRLKAFVSMSGCQTIIEKKEGYYVVRITGSVCCA
jgi:hypothetical protein